MAGFVAYDALMWDNALAGYEGERVHVPGFERAFVGEDRRRYGSPARPCPRLALLPGRGCDAVLFRIPRRARRYLFHNLRQREARPLRRARVRDASGRPARARCLGVAGHERRWPGRDAVIEGLRGARGVVGTGAEYIRAVVHAMELWGIEDPVVAGVWDEVRRWTAGTWRDPTPAVAGAAP